MNRREAIAALTGLPAVASIARAEVKPNDMVVIECERHLTLEDAKYIRDTMERVWPGRKVAVLGPGMKMKIVQEQQDGKVIAGNLREPQ